MSGRTDPSLEEPLLERCLAGEAGAWQSLFQRHHGKLVRAARRLVGPDLAEDVAAEVWRALLEADRGALRRFDPRRGSLTRFLNGMARREVNRLRRRELRPLYTLEPGTTPLDHRTLPPDWSVFWEEFLTFLSPAERRFLEEHLLGTAGKTAALPRSDANSYKLRQRVRAKLRSFLNGGDSAAAPASREKKVAGRCPKTPLSRQILYGRTLREFDGGPRDVG